jgi:hypothetical protein
MKHYRPLALIVLLTAPLPSARTAEGTGNLVAALKKTAAGKSYAFSVEQTPVSQKAPVEGKYQKDQPIYCKAEKIEFYRKGDTLVYKDGTNWVKSRTGRLSDPLRILGASAKVRALRLPHDELAALGKALKDVKKGDKGKYGTVYTATLTKDSARKLAPTEYHGSVQGGTAKLWVDGKGRVHKYQTTIDVAGRRGNAEVKGRLVKTVTLTGIDATQVSPPDDAKKALE